MKEGEMTDYGERSEYMKSKQLIVMKYTINLSHTSFYFGVSKAAVQKNINTHT